MPEEREREREPERERNKASREKAAEKKEEKGGPSRLVLLAAGALAVFLAAAGGVVTAIVFQPAPDAGRPSEGEEGRTMRAVAAPEGIDVSRVRPPGRPSGFMDPPGGTAGPWGGWVRAADPSPRPPSWRETERSHRPTDVPESPSAPWPSAPDTEPAGRPRPVRVGVHASEAWDPRPAPVAPETFRGEPVMLRSVLRWSGESREGDGKPMRDVETRRIQ